MELDHPSNLDESFLDSKWFVPDAHVVINLCRTASSVNPVFIVFFFGLWFRTGYSNIFVEKPITSSSQHMHFICCNIYTHSSISDVLHAFIYFHQFITMFRTIVTHSRMICNLNCPISILAWKCFRRKIWILDFVSVLHIIFILHIFFVRVRFHWNRNDIDLIIGYWRELVSLILGLS